MSILEQISETFNRSKAIRVPLSHLQLSNKCETSPTGGVVHKRWIWTWDISEWKVPKAESLHCVYSRVSRAAAQACHMVKTDAGLHVHLKKNISTRIQNSRHPQNVGCKNDFTAVFNVIFKTSICNFSAFYMESNAIN